MLPSVCAVVQLSPSDIHIHNQSVVHYFPAVRKCHLRQGGYVLITRRFSMCLSVSRITQKVVDELWWIVGGVPWVNSKNWWDFVDDPVTLRWVSWLGGGVCAVRVLSCFIKRLRLLPARRSKRGLCYGDVARWVSVCHTPVLYQNGKTYLKTFSTIWKPHHSGFFWPLCRYPIPREPLHLGR